MTSFRRILAATAVALCLPAGLSAGHGDGVAIRDAYARFMPGAKSGAAFMVIDNNGHDDDRLTGASSDIAAKVELHTHKHGADGTMQMMAVPEGFAIPAHDGHALERGGDHVMLMGLTRVPAEGEVVTLTLTFEKAGAVTIEVPVDNAN